MMDDPHLTGPTPTWSWANIEDHNETSATPAPPDNSNPPEAEAEFAPTTEAQAADGDAAAEGQTSAGTRRHYRPRTCRICLEDVEPTFETPNTATQYLRQKPRVRYVSEDPDLGRLFSPCKCKGSQKYVHEGCLRAWRGASPANRNLWECPTCKFQYRLQRLTWGTWASSKLVRAALTLLVLFLTVFLLGFVADPIIRFGSIGPLAMLADEFEELEDWIPDEQPNSWWWHFTRGFFAVGFVGILKTLVSLGPWHWNYRFFGGARRRRGRDALEDVNLALVVVGVGVFLLVS